MPTGHARRQLPPMPAISETCPSGEDVAPHSLGVSHTILRERGWRRPLLATVPVMPASRLARRDAGHPWR